MKKKRTEGNGLEISIELRNENNTSSSAHLTSLLSATWGHDTHTQTHEMPSVRLAGVIALLWVQLCLRACARIHAYLINPSFFMNPSFCSLAGGVCLLGVEKVAYPHAISIAAKIWRENEVKWGSGAILGLCSLAFVHYTIWCLNKNHWSHLYMQSSS